MRNKLICYVNSIFEGIPNTPEVQELREEILQNTLDRYDEECARGVSETVAYNVAVMSIGDTDELLAAYRKPKKEKKKLSPRLRGDRHCAVYPVRRAARRCS